MGAQVPAAAQADMMMKETLARIATMASLRAAVELRLHDIVPETGSIGLPKLAQESGAAEELLARLLRPLLCSGIFAEAVDTNDDKAQYAHTPLSLGFRDARLRAAFLHGFDETLPAFAAQHRWLQGHGWRSPEASDDCPFAATHGGDSLFGHLAKHPEKAAVFAADNEHAFVGVAGVYPFDEQVVAWAGAEGEDDVMVDVGGGRGQACRELVRAHPGLRGRIVLQDMEEVLRGVPDDVRAVVRDTMPYNFFDPQPLKGAAVYYLRRILCDWPDAACKAILRNQAGAMDARSRLLVAALVVPETGCDPLTAASDAVMMTFGGKERTEAQFRELLKSAGLSLVKVWRKPGEPQCVLEARLNVQVLN